MENKPNWFKSKYGRTWHLYVGDVELKSPRRPDLPGAIYAKGACNVEHPKGQCVFAEMLGNGRMCWACERKGGLAVADQ